MAIVPWSPLANGFLTGKYDHQPSDGAGRLSPGSQWPMPVTPTEQHWQILHLLRTIAAEVGRTPAQVAPNWIISRPAVLGTLVGATSVEQLDANLDALRIELSPDQRAMLDQASRPQPLMTPHKLFARLPARPPYVHRAIG